MHCHYGVDGAGALSTLQQLASIGPHRFQAFGHSKPALPAECVSSVSVWLLLCCCCCCFAGSPLGGRASDVAGAKWSRVPQARLVFNVAAALVVMPAGLLVYGWTLDRGTHIVGPLVGHFVIGVASAAYLPGMFGYISTIKQQNASAAAAAVQASMFIIAAVLIYASVSGVSNLGFGWFFTLLAAIHAVIAAIAALCLWRSFSAVYRAGSQHNHPTQQQDQQRQQEMSHQSSLKKAMNSRVELLQAAEEGKYMQDSPRGV